MQAQTYVKAFAARGVLLWREGDLLRYDAPAGVLTPAVLEKLREAKEKILPTLPNAPPLDVHLQTEEEFQRECRLCLRRTISTLPAIQQ